MGPVRLLSMSDVIKLEICTVCATDGTMFHVEQLQFLRVKWDFECFGGKTVRAMRSKTHRPNNISKDWEFTAVPDLQAAIWSQNALNWF
jgi:hypothetical protein